jgi:hypothetical protein
VKLRYPSGDVRRCLLRGADVGCAGLHAQMVKLADPARDPAAAAGAAAGGVVLSYHDGHDMVSIATETDFDEALRLAVVQARTRDGGGGPPHLDAFVRLVPAAATQTAGPTATRGTVPAVGATATDPPRYEAFPATLAATLTAAARAAPADAEPPVNVATPGGGVGAAAVILPADRAAGGLVLQRALGPLTDVLTVVVMEAAPALARMAAALNTRGLLTAAGWTRRLDVLTAWERAILVGVVSVVVLVAQGVWALVGAIVSALWTLSLFAAAAMAVGWVGRAFHRERVHPHEQ